VIKAESQAVLNTLTEHDFQEAFKKWQKHWEQCIHAEEYCFEAGGGGVPKVNFFTRWQHQSRTLWMSLCTFAKDQVQQDRMTYLLAVWWGIGHTRSNCQ
jgi:hypothetical protein